MNRLRRLTLVQLFVLTTLAIALAVGITFSVFLESSRRSVVRRSDQLRDEAARQIGARLSAELNVARTVLDDVEGAMRFGALSADDPIAVETRLFSELLAHPTLSDVTLTHASLLGHEPSGDARLAPGDRWQISVFRASADPKSEIITRRVSAEADRFVAYTRRRPRGAGLFAVPFERKPGAVDPTRHLTFETTVSQGLYGKAIPSDLSYSELDQALPQAERRVVVTVQKALEDAPGHFAGVLRVGLLTRTIDELPLQDTRWPQRVLLCDAEGRLVARLDPSDRLELMGNDLRVVSAHPPPEVAAALENPGLRQLSAAEPARSDRLLVGGAPFLVTFRALENSQGWVVGILVPEDYYTRDLRALRERFLFAVLAVTAIVLVLGGFLMLELRRSLGRVVAATARMRGFDFSPSPVDAPLREMADVMEGVERAKTSMRALGKYVPIDLVRELFESNREPELGGELMEISLMFSDIEGFTSLSERLAPHALAQALGRYLEAMTDGVRSTHGTVDKFIGDSVMAFWNAPARCPDHALRACRAVLACLRTTRDLYASSAWKGLPPLFTRFGLHKAKVMVGHFGAPERLSYTALGDGVNLASRLEGLCKRYGVAVLASEAIADDVRDELAFRFIDKVAVKGKTESVRVYELLGVRSECAEALARANTYERALEAYFARDFSGALAILGAAGDDPPSLVLADRCQAMLARPPPEDWNGVYVATAK
jgi:adenylate cyclase